MIEAAQAGRPVPDPDVAVIVEAVMYLAASLIAAEDDHKGLLRAFIAALREKVTNMRKISNQAFH